MWTQQLLATRPDLQGFARGAEITLCAGDLIHSAHELLAAPSSESYRREGRQARSELACLRHHRGRVCFYGHTHMVRAEIADAEGRIVLPLVEAWAGEGADPRPVRLGGNEVAWIGTGSVGFPRNDKRWPEFLVLDDTDWRIEKYLVAYDRAAARATTSAVLTAACGAAVAGHIEHWL